MTLQKTSQYSGLGCISPLPSASSLRAQYPEFMLSFELPPAHPFPPSLCLPPPSFSSHPVGSFRRRLSGAGNAVPTNQSSLSSKHSNFPATLPQTRSLLVVGSTRAYSFRGWLHIVTAVHSPAPPEDHEPAVRPRAESSAWSHGSGRADPPAQYDPAGHGAETVKPWPVAVVPKLPARIRRHRVAPLSGW